jgi:hypothetical protein
MNTPHRLASALPPDIHQEHAVTEQLVQEHPHPLPKRRTLPEKALIPQYGELYGSLKTKGGWRYMVDNYANGTITTVAASQQTATVTLKLPPNWSLERYPGATQLFLCIRQFALAPQAPLTTLGDLVCLYQDTVGGQILPLGVFPSTTGGNANLTSIIPTPITDPGNTNIGTLLVSLSSGATAGTYDWQLSFSAAFLLPNIEGYKQIERHSLYEQLIRDSEQSDHDCGCGKH